MPIKTNRDLDPQCFLRIPMEVDNIINNFLISHHSIQCTLLRCILPTCSNPLSANLINRIMTMACSNNTLSRWCSWTHISWIPMATLQCSSSNNNSGSAMMKNKQEINCIKWDPVRRRLTSDQGRSTKKKNYRRKLLISRKNENLMNQLSSQLLLTTLRNKQLKFSRFKDNKNNKQVSCK